MWVSGVSRETLCHCLAEGLGVAYEHGQVLVALIDRQGEPATRQQLQVLVSAHRPPRQQALYERISQLRDVMGRDAIAGFTPAADRARHGKMQPVTYALSPEGFEIVQAALRRVAERLRLIHPHATENRAA